MRRPLTFDCGGATLAGLLHPAAGGTGIVIVTGGVQTRAGSHRGFVDLADRLAAAGFPVLRFDRRGVGDSDGENSGFRDSAPDIAAAITALRRACPGIRRVIGWGLCDGASALALHGAALGLDGLILANPWTRDADDAIHLTTPRCRGGPLPRPPHAPERMATPGAWRARLQEGGARSPPPRATRTGSKARALAG